MYRRDIVYGITTAAVIWMTAGIGMTVGVGLYILAIGTFFFGCLFSICVAFKKSIFSDETILCLSHKV